MLLRQGAAQQGKPLTYPAHRHTAGPAHPRPFGGGVLTTLRPTTDRCATRLLCPIDGDRIALRDQVAAKLLAPDQTLKEFGKIPKSDFILRFIDDVELRQAIEKQLNKGESANKFSKAISFGNNHDFLYGEKVEQETAEGCRRLIKNVIICWNYLYLSQKLADTDDPEAREAFLQAVASGSVVTWRHINLLGEYDFSDEKLRDSVGIRPPKLTG